MKAIKPTKKYALPMLLFGLLALETPWHQIIHGQNFGSGSFASTQQSQKTRAEVVNESAVKACTNPNNYITAAMMTAQRQGSSQFVFKDKDMNDIKTILKSGKQQAKISYNGAVRIEKVNSSPVELAAAEKYMGQRASFSQRSQQRPTDEERREDSEAVLDRNGAEKKNIYGSTETAIRKYDVFKITVTTQTTEGDWCRDCSDESKSVTSEVRYVKVKVSPNADANSEVCVDAFSNAQQLFELTEKEMKRDILDDLKAIAEAAEQEEKEEYLQTQIDNCKIRDNATIDDLRDDKSVDEDLTFKGKPTDKMECMIDKIGDIDSNQEKNKFFKANIVDHLQAGLTSTDTQVRSETREQLTQLMNGNSGRLTSYQSAHLQMMASGANELDQIYRLTGQLENLRGTQYESTVQTQLDNFKSQLAMKYQMISANGSIEQADAYGFWYNKISTLTNSSIYNSVPTIDTSVNTSALTSAVYNGSGRVARLANGTNPLGSSFNAAISQISATPDFVRSAQQSVSNAGYIYGGSNAYEQQLTNINSYSTPFPESATSRRQAQVRGI